MEQAYHHIGFFLLFQDGHIFAGCLFHIVEAQAFPQVLGEPGWDAWGNHAQYSYLDAIALKNLIGLEMGLARSCFDDVGTQYREVAVVGPTVEHRTAHLHIVVAHVASIVAHEAQHFACQVARLLVDVVIVVGRGLSLQDIAVVEQQHVVAILLAKALDISMHSCQAAFHISTVDKVVGIEASMHIAGFNYSQFHRLRLP